MNTKGEETILLTTEIPKSDESQKVSSQQWLVLVVSFLGWMMDSMDGSLFLLVQTPALHDLLHTTDKKEISEMSGIILSVFLIGAALGGVLSGVFADIFGRAHVMMLTVVLYSAGTALCALCQTPWQLAVLRFVTGIGTGGEWACGASLVAEVWPNRYRTTVGPVLQAGGGMGYLCAGLLYAIVIPFGWRAVFLCGLLPAVFGLSVRFFVNESEMWQLSRQCNPLGFTDAMHVIMQPPHRRNTISMTAVMGMLVLVYWSTSAWIPSIVRDIVTDHPQGSWDVDNASTSATIALNIGAMCGALSWIWSARVYGRKTVIAALVVAQMIVIPACFQSITNLNLLIPLLPIVGFCSAGVFGGMPIYLPELFPTSVRATGTAFVFNAGRILAATGPIMMGILVGWSGSYESAASIMPLCHIVTLVCLVFAKETKGQGLPE